MRIRSLPDTARSFHGLAPGKEQSASISLITGAQNCGHNRQTEIPQSLILWCEECGGLLQGNQLLVAPFIEERA